MTRTLAARIVRATILVLVAVAVGLYMFHVSPAARASVIPPRSPIGTNLGGNPVMLPHPGGVCIRMVKVVTHRHHHRHIRFVCVARVWEPVRFPGGVVIF